MKDIFGYCVPNSGGKISFSTDEEYPWPGRTCPLILYPV